MIYLRLAMTCAVLLVSRAASADDVSTLRAKFAESSASVKSFVLTVQYKTLTGIGMTMTILPPQRMKGLMTVGQTSVETYLIDGVMYLHTPMRGWQQTSMSAVLASPRMLNMLDSIRSAQMAPLPDRRENGVPFGVVAISLPLPGVQGDTAAGGTQQLTCSYDKTTFRMQYCSNEQYAVTFTKYNDPGNRFDLPAEARTATPLVLPGLGPSDDRSASPAPPVPAASAPAASAPPQPSATP